MSEAQEKAHSDKRKTRKIVAGIAALILVVVAVYVGYSVWNGDLAPSDTAAKYDGFNYLPESEVSDYIGVYRAQMGLADSTDEDWATFLAAYNLTPQRLRYSTIRQLITDAFVAKRADELGLAANEDEVDAAIETLRNTLGMGDDEILLRTLEAHGQTLDGLREVYRKGIVKQLVLSADVETPTPTDDEVKAYMKTYNSQLTDPTVRHTYCFKLDGVAESGDRDKVTQVQELQKQFAAGDKTVEEFAAMVQMYSNDDELVSNGGANGWEIDAEGYSNTYVGVMENLKKGDVSDVFRDGDSCCFIWVDDEFTLPTEASAIEAFDLASMPESLLQYMKDSAAHKLWEEAGQHYLDKLLDEADIVYYPMPSDVPYNVDMSLANVQLEEAESSESSQ